MTTQKDIQELIDRTQEKIRSGDLNGARNDWPEIKSAIGEYEGFDNSLDRTKLEEQVKKQLDDSSPSKHKLINIAEIEQYIKKDKGVPGNPKRVPPWLF